MMRILVSPAIREQAAREAEEMGGVHNSILNGAGNAAGIAAELVVAELIGAERRNTKDYDLVLPDGVTVDVKCKRTKYAPEPDFEASVAKTSLHQQCDIYCFSRILYSLSWVYVVGFYPKDLYFQNATPLRKGDYDPSNDFTVKWSCFNLPHHELMSWEQAHQYVKERVPA